VGEGRVAYRDLTLRLLVVSSVYRVAVSFRKSRKDTYSNKLNVTSNQRKGNTSNSVLNSSGRILCRSRLQDTDRVSPAFGKTQMNTVYLFNWPH
jgi:hypothetical protein